MAAQTGNAAPMCEAGLPFKLPDGFNPDDFLYQGNGPWPCTPENEDACKVAPEVLDVGPHCIPEKEEEKWEETLGKYYSPANFSGFATSAIDYASDLLGLSPISWKYEFEILADILAWYNFGRPFTVGDEQGLYPALSDETFTDMIAHGLLSKLMSKLDPPDRSVFQGLLNDETLEYWKCDLTHMMAVRKPLEDEYVAPTIVLMSRARIRTPDKEYDFKVEAIQIFEQLVRGGPYDQWGVLKPGAGKPWQLAKYFALQGALVRLNLVDHTMVHFPADAINAITKSVLPLSNPVLQLLLPHLLLSLPVDNAVLRGKHSLLNRTETYPYSPYPAKGDEIRKVFPFYWLGSDPPRDAFPPYSFPTEPREMPSRYGSFLDGYFQPILNFARGVVKSMPDDGRNWETIRFWADHVASWVPGFPDGQAMYKNGDLLAHACASIIWNASIVHTADHWLMHQMFEQKLPTPYVLRDKPLLSADPGVDPDYRPAVWLIRDAIPARMCDLMFFMPHSTTQLSAFDYAFPYDLGPLIEAFKHEMTATDAKLHQQFPEFGISLYAADPVKDGFAAGVQF